MRLRGEKEKKRKRKEEEGIIIVLKKEGGIGFCSQRKKISRTNKSFPKKSTFLFILFFVSNCRSNVIPK